MLPAYRRETPERNSRGKNQKWVKLPTGAPCSVSEMVSHNTVDVEAGVRFPYRAPWGCS